MSHVSILYQEVRKMPEPQVRRMRLQTTSESGRAAESSILETLRLFLEEISAERRRKAHDSFKLELDVSSLPILVEPHFLMELVNVVSSYRTSFDIIDSLRILVRSGIQATFVRLAVAAVVFNMPIEVEELLDAD